MPVLQALNGKYFTKGDAKMRTVKVLSFIVSLLCLCGMACGMSSENFGPDSQIGHPTTAQPDWATGIEEVPRHPSRVYSIWGNGGQSFYFKSNPKQINELIDLFSKARLRDHEVFIKTKKPKIQSFRKIDIDYNAYLKITGGIARHFLQEKNPSETLDPVLTIYVDGDAGWVRDLKIPDNIILNSDIDGIVNKGKRTKPKRAGYYGQLQFKDSPTPIDFISGLRAEITLWEKDNPKYFKLTNVMRNGYFNVALSDKELADIKSGKSNLRVTVGNWLTKARKDHLVFPPKMLGVKDKIKPFIVARPQFYYGRILFEDGTPPLLNPLPWPGAEISISFSYAGSATIDEKGSFKVFFTDEQYKKLMGQKDRRNIYIPSYTKKNTGTAKHIFPVSVLTKDKDKPGVVKIPRPVISEGQSKMFKEDKNGNFILYVSNQSFAINPVDIQVFVDNKKVIDRTFDVVGKKGVGQHNWIPFHFKASAGRYSLQVKSKKGKAVLDAAFKITDKHWAVIDYWNYPKVTGGAGPTPPKFSFNIQNKPIGFE